MKFQLHYLLLLIFALGLLPGCGSGGGTAGNGNTVFIQASVQQGANAAIFVNISSGFLVANSTSFTVTSTPFSTAGTIPNSDVQINRISYRYTPAPPLTTAFTPSVTFIPWPGGSLAPGGTEDLENVPVLWPQDLPAFVAACNGTNGFYNVTVTISGVEVNTGNSVSTSTPISVFCPLAQP